MRRVALVPFSSLHPTPESIGFFVENINFYDIDWQRINASSDHENFESDIPKPENFAQMLRIAERLSEDFPEVRVDLYNIKGKIYFGELTFYPWSGYVQFEPDEFDYQLGKQFVLPVKSDK